MNSGWWFGCHFLFSHILGISSSQLTFIFFRGVAQPPTRIYQTTLMSGRHQLEGAAVGLGGKPIACWLDTWGRGFRTLEGYLIYSTFSWNMVNHGWFWFEMSHFNMLEQGPMFWKSIVLSFRWWMFSVNCVACIGASPFSNFGGDVHSHTFS